MNVRKLPTRISGDHDAARDQAGQPGFGPRDLPHNRYLDLIPFTV